jgi:hypothetical protein
MRWIPWALGLAGVAQHALVALLKPEDYISLDTSYLVMWLAVIGALVVCYLSCWDCSDDGDCDCCPDHCHCGDCPACSQEHDH